LAHQEQEASSQVLLPRVEVPMFYCKKCQVENEWPEGMRRSYGQCELCGHSRPCFDVPSSALPLPKVKRRKPSKQRYTRERK
jgi:hypothetical protein